MTAPQRVQEESGIRSTTKVPKNEGCSESRTKDEATASWETQPWKLRAVTPPQARLSVRELEGRRVLTCVCAQARALRA